AAFTRRVALTWIAVALGIAAVAAGSSPWVVAGPDEVQRAALIAGCTALGLLAGSMALERVDRDVLGEPLAWATLLSAAVGSGLVSPGDLAALEPARLAVLPAWIGLAATSRHPAVWRAAAALAGIEALVLANSVGLAIVPAQPAVPSVGAALLGA